MRRNTLTILIVTIIMSCIMAALGILTAVNHYHYSEEGLSEYVIETEEDFYKLSKNHEALKNIILKNDITLTKEFDSIGSKDKPFASTFDGRGYTISVNGIEAQKNSLFGYTSKNSKIMNLEVKMQGGAAHKQCHSFLVRNNHGLITNINVYSPSLNIGNDILFGAICAVNYGTVSYSYVETQLTNLIPNEDHRKASVLGGAVGYNEGVIDSVISRIIFMRWKETDKKAILSGTVNNTIGMVYGVNNGKVENIKNNYMIDFNDYYLSDQKFTSNILKEKFEFNEDILLNKFHFNNKIWKLVIIDAEKLEYRISLMDGVKL